MPKIPLPKLATLRRLRAIVQATLLVTLTVAAALLSSTASAQVGLLQTKAGELPITVVYPTAATATPQRLGPFEISVALDAAPSPGNGRLVVFSHGAGGDALTLHGLASTLARGGFVVAQPEHRGDNWRDRSAAGPESWSRRPLEASQAIDAIAQDPRFNKLVKFDRVGVFGMSAGGGTGLALAGGDWSVASLLGHCAEHLQDDAGFCLYGARSKDDATQRAQSYYKPPPPDAAKQLGGARVHDARVTAVALSVPVGAIFTPQSLAAIRMPVGIVQADSDRILKPRYHADYVLAHCGRCERLDTLAGAGHFDVLWPWPDVIAQSNARMPEGARNPAIDDARRQQADKTVAKFFSKNLLP